MPGYSKRTLSEKLGVKPGARLVVLGGPRSYSALLGSLPSGATVSSHLSSNAPFIHRFARRQSELRSDFGRLARALADDGMLWFSWPKQSSGAETDLDENVVREIGLAEGLVDVKVCAVDELWSGLKFVRRMANRKPR
jgi:hypothetical protein